MVIKIGSNFTTNVIYNYLILILLAIIVIYYIYCMINKHYKILEKFNNEATLTYYNYGEKYKGDRKGAVKNTLHGKITLRPCQIYFVGGEDNIKKCDEEYEKDSSSTCKYVFNDNWKEIDNIKNSDDSVNTYPKKIYNQSFTQTFTNQPLTSQCFKKFNNGSDMRFIYQNNDLVKYDYSGIDESNTLVLNHKYDGVNSDYSEGKFISMRFDNNNDTSNNYKNVVDSICSKKKNEIESLKNLTINSENPYFYKFGLDSNNQLIIENINGKIIPDIKLVELNTKQNKFEEREMNNFTVQSLLGIDFSNIKNSDNKTMLEFNVFKVVSLSKIDCTVYKFNYDYLCDNSIKNYKSLPGATLNLNSFMSVTTGTIIGKKKWSIPYEETLINNEFWNNFKYISGDRTSRLQNIIDALHKENKRQIAIISGNKNIDINNFIKILNWYKNKKKFYESKKDDISKLKFTELMDIKKEDYITIDNNTIVFNPIVKPYNYKPGYLVHITRPESPFNVNVKYQSGKSGKSGTFKTIYPINLLDLTINYVNSVVFGDKGLNGSAYYYYLNDNGTWKGQYGYKYSTKRTEYFYNIWHLGHGTSEQYTWYWKGYFYAHESGEYHFATSSDDASYIYLNNEMVLNNGGLHGMQWATNFKKIELKQGEWRTFEMTFGENYGGDDIKFYWKKATENNWNQTAHYNNKCWFFTSITDDSGDHTINLSWTFDKNDGTYTAEYNSNKTINSDNIKLDGKNIIISTGTIPNDIPPGWKKITLKDSDKNNLYDMYINGDLKTKIQFKIKDKYNTLKDKTEYILDGDTDDGRNAFPNVNNNNISLWWNKNESDIKNDHQITINAWQPILLTITSFIFLQKGRYIFKPNLGLPGKIMIRGSRFTINDKEINTLNKHPINSGGFYRMSYSCFALNDSNENVNANFTINADCYNINDTVIGRDIVLNAYLYGGSRLYTHYNNSTFNQQFENLKILENNENINFSKIKEYLNQESGEGKDFWNLNNIDNAINFYDKKKRESDNSLRDNIIYINTYFTNLINKFSNLNYEKEFLNAEYFDEIKVVYNPTNLSSIVTTSNNIDISSYITNEKIKLITDRTPKNLNENYNYKNNTKKSLYILKESITKKSITLPP